MLSPAMAHTQNHSSNYDALTIYDTHHQLTGSLTLTKKSMVGECTIKALIEWPETLTLAKRFFPYRCASGILENSNNAKGN